MVYKALKNIKTTTQKINFCRKYSPPSRKKTFHLNEKHYKKFIF